MTKITTKCTTFLQDLVRTFRINQNRLSQSYTREKHFFPSSIARDDDTRSKTHSLEVVRSLPGLEGTQDLTISRRHFFLFSWRIDFMSWILSCGLIFATYFLGNVTTSQDSTVRLLRNEYVICQEYVHLVPFNRVWDRNGISDFLLLFLWCIVVKGGLVAITAVTAKGKKERRNTNWPEFP